MIIGDGAYGVIFLIVAIAMTIKFKKVNNAIFLVYVLSIATIVWGAITGTWFGTEAAMKIPILKALVIPNFANYPELFGVTATQQQNTIMKFSFTLGVIQISLGALLSIKKKVQEKNLSFVADIGWMIAIISMYLLSLFLVIGQKINIKPVFAAIIVAFIIVVLFGGMEPGKTFAQGLKAGLANAFTVFLDTISCFGNVMSYIRLFAVGMASLAIAQSFNDIAAGFHGPLIIVAILVLLIGHGLNLIMALLSVVVHGVRLNVLEFSGQAGLEWTGIAYDPFKEDDKIKN
jgi:V/A-type H+-transporting ATPase subunit I